MTRWNWLVRSSRDTCYIIKQYKDTSWQRLLVRFSVFGTHIGFVGRDLLNVVLSGWVDLCTVCDWPEHCHLRNYCWLWCWKVSTNPLGGGFDPVSELPYPPCQWFSQLIKLTVTLKHHQTVWVNSLKVNVVFNSSRCIQVILL